MNKQTKMILGVVLLGGVGYYIYKQSKAPKSFANLASTSMRGCPCVKVAQKDSPAKGWDTCAGGQACQRDAKNQPY